MKQLRPPANPCAFLLASEQFSAAAGNHEEELEGMIQLL
jgi:hypothetical protein